MKVFGILGFALLSWVTLSGGEAQAQQPWSFQGRYEFRGQILPLMRRTVDVIDARMPQAAARVQALKQAGARCDLVNSQTTRCLTLLPGAQVPADSLARLAQQSGGLAIDFGAVTAPPVIVTQGDSFMEWQISQDGRWNGGPFVSYRYLLLRDGPAKIVLAGSPKELWLNSNDGRTLQRYDSLVVPESRWRWHEDSGLAQIEKVRR